ncbi:MAG: protein kinase [Akkermansiaceae bacterium]|nr:protein kinase [Akkermansiaceae bacterium]
MIHHIAERLYDLHTAGYVHRDLKPGNVMWLPRQNRWTLIDFGSAAPLGEQARMSYSLAYAAPEIIHAVRAGEDMVTASDKLDAWSLGVMAVELLTNKPPFNLLVDGKEKVCVPLCTAAACLLSHVSTRSTFQSSAELLCEDDVVVGTTTGAAQG